MLRKLAREPGFRVETTREWATLVPSVAALYEQVFAGADARFERLCADFFATLLEAEIDTSLITCWDGKRLVGCLVCLVSDGRCVSFRIGLDYRSPDSTTCLTAVTQGAMRAC